MCRDLLDDHGLVQRGRVVLRGQHVLQRIADFEFLQHGAEAKTRKRQRTELRR